MIMTLNLSKVYAYFQNLIKINKKILSFLCIIKYQNFRDFDSNEQDESKIILLQYDDKIKYSELELKQAVENLNK